MSVESMMDKINGSGFDFIRNLENIILTYMYSPPPTAYTSDTDTVSWYVFTDGGVEGDWTFSMFSDSDHPVKVSHRKGIDTITISKEGNIYSCQLYCDYYYTGDSSYYFYRTNYPDRSSCGFYTGSYFTGNFQPLVQGWVTKTLTSNSLEGILGEISKYAKNVNIVIDEPTYTSNGGGATHIAKVTGQLKDLSSNLSDILMVSGGGGGGLLVGDTDYSGKEAGGISGSGDNSADQSTGNAFGQGESGTNLSGGGSGLYGGYKGTSAKSGGAGSGYIGNSLLSNKKMVGYNVPTSSAEGTKTESVNDVSASAVSGKPKSGNGFARIKFLREPPSLSYKNAIILPENSYSVKGKNTETTYTMSQIKQTFSNNNIMLLLYDTNGYIALPMSASSGWALKMASGQYAKNDGQLDWFYGFNNTANPLYPHYLSGGSMPVSWSLQYTTIDNVQYYDDAYTGGTEEHPAILICSLSEFDIYKDGIFDRHYTNG